MLEKVFGLLDTRGKRLIVLITITLLFLSALLVFLLNSYDLRERLDDNQQQSLESVLKGGKLVVICETSTITYFKNRNIAMGYEYEILKHIAKKLDLKLEMLPFDGTEEMNNALIENRGHLIADFRVTGNMNPELFVHTHPHTMSVICLVQRIPGKKEKNRSLVSDIYQLDGHKIHVQVNSIAHKKLVYFADEYALDLEIVAVNNSREELLEKVSKGQIEFTVIEREIIAANRDMFNNLDYSLRMSFPYRISFTLKSNSTPLRDTMNTIIDSFVVTDDYKRLVYKYIDSENKSFHRKISLLLLNGMQISKLDKKIKMEAAKINWDWRLLSSLILKESRFEAYVVSKQGTYGLMQFVSRTGAKYGVYPNSTPEVQIEGGVKYLEFLQNMYPEVDQEQRPKFVLASYNAGPAHILDARCVARHHKEDANDWTVVSKYLLKLNQAEYYNLECVKHGAYNGQAVVGYVNKVYSRFDELAQIYPEN